MSNLDDLGIEKTEASRWQLASAFAGLLEERIDKAAATAAEDSTIPVVSVAECAEEMGVPERTA